LSAAAALRRVRELALKTLREWNEDKVPRLAAALAYYTLVSLAPLVIFAIRLAGVFFGRDAARDELVAQFDRLVGPVGAQAVAALIDAAPPPGTGHWATLLGVATLVFGASGVFAQLQDAFNTIWEVQPRPGRGPIRWLRRRLVSFTMVVGTGFLLLVSLLVSAALAAAGRFVGGLLPAAASFWQGVTGAVVFAATAVLFAAIFRLVPDVRVRWRDVWPAAVVTAALFGLGREAIGLYLGHSALASSYGAAASLLAVVLWVYYSAQVLFLGAEFTQVFARHRARRPRPAP
jgi:membrane protein